LACLEDIDADAWFANSRAEARPHIDKAAVLFEEAREKFTTAFMACTDYRDWLPSEQHNELAPDLDTYRQLAEIMEQIVASLREYELPTLRQIHSADELMRTEMIVGERRAVAMRGTPGHFPLDVP